MVSRISLSTLSRPIETQLTDSAQRFIFETQLFRNSASKTSLETRPRDPLLGDSQLRAPQLRESQVTRLKAKKPSLETQIRHTDKRISVENQFRDAKLRHLQLKESQPRDS